MCSTAKWSKWLFCFTSIFLLWLLSSLASFASLDDYIWSYGSHNGYSDRRFEHWRYVACYLNGASGGLGQFRREQCHFTDYYTLATNSYSTTHNSYPFSFLRLLKLGSVQWYNHTEIPTDKAVRIVQTPGGNPLCRNKHGRKLGFVKNNRCFILKRASPGLHNRVPNYQVLTFKREPRVLIDDAGTHAQRIKQILLNQAHPKNSQIISYDRANSDEVFFNPAREIKYFVAENYEHNYGRLDSAFHIVNMSYSQHHSGANDNFLLNESSFPAYPLVVTSAGNGANICTERAYRMGIDVGLSAYALFQYYGCTRETYHNGTCSYKEEIDKFYKACDMLAANTIQKTDRGNNWIVVGSSGHLGQRPGPILKDRWISTYYHYTFSDGSNGEGTSYGAPFVAKLAVEIKNRAMHYTNDQIAQLIFSTADDMGEPGVDETWGHGRLNVKAVLDELSKRGF